jgi:tRNA (cytidine/uridine-2'-O-)-methyltransferase
VRLVLYQPDIPQNTGTLLRLAACLNLGVDVVEPCGFTLSDARLKRAGLDYIARAHLTVHASWARYVDAAAGRLIALSPHAATAYTDLAFAPGDNLLLGPESTGLPREVLARTSLSAAVPQAAGTRSLNVAVAGAMVAGEALRQTAGFPDPGPATEAT